MLKFFIDTATFRRELDARAFDLDQKYVLGILAAYEGEELIEATKSNPRFAKYNSVLVLEASDRTLDQIWSFERPEVDQTIQYLQNIASALDHLHAKRLVYGIVNPKSVVRVNRRVVLNNLEACGPIGSVFGHRYASAFNPPEFVKRVGTRGFSLRSFRLIKGDYVDSATGEKVSESALLALSASIDAWGLGAVAFLLLANEPLFKADRDDNLEPTELKRLACWSVSDVQSLRRFLPDTVAFDFVAKLLDPDPLKRPSMTTALAHPLITGDAPLAAAIRQSVAAQGGSRTSDEDKAIFSYLSQKVDPLFVPLMKKLTREKPVDPVRFCSEYMLGLLSNQGS